MKKFEIIGNQNIPLRRNFLWRYLDMHKFINLITHKEILFARMDQFEDPLEGVPLYALISFAEEQESRNTYDLRLGDVIMDKNKKVSPELRRRINSINGIQNSTYVSCWFQSTRESMAMWNLYSNPDGIAIRINTHTLINEIREASEKMHTNGISAMYCGKVRYQDFKRIDLEEGNEEMKVPKVALRKDKSYEHENEFRFVIRTKSNLEVKPFIPVKLDKLYETRITIICHPLMDKWKKENIEYLLEAHGMNYFFKESEITLRRR
jgi:hypothetical protein